MIRHAMILAAAAVMLGGCVHPPTVVDFDDEEERQQLQRTFRSDMNWIEQGFDPEVMPLNAFNCGNNGLEFELEADSRLPRWHYAYTSGGCLGQVLIEDGEPQYTDRALRWRKQSRQQERVQ